MPAADSTIRASKRRRAALLLAALIFAAGAAAGQIPEEFQNLQVLPKDVEKRQLVELMKSFCAALDVRCTHCHAGEEGAPLSEIDFPSDDKQAKQVARAMMRMVEAINGTYLPRTGREPAELSRVSCLTCHRGQVEPRTLERLLADAVAEDGVDAAVARYRELRERHYGDGTFDFSAGTLTRLASRLAGDDQIQAAITFLELNVELYPQEMTSYFLLGDLHARSGDEANAIKSFEQVLTLDPKNPIVQRKLDQLKAN